MIDLSILATPLALLTVAAPPPPDPAEPPPPFSTNPPSRVLLERAALRWEEWYWRQEGTVAVRGVSATCGPSRPRSRERRCFVTYLATAPEEASVQIIDWFRRCRVVRGTGNTLVDAPPASGGAPMARIGIGKGRQMECVFSGFAVDPSAQAGDWEMWHEPTTANADKRRAEIAEATGLWRKIAGILRGAGFDPAVIPNPAPKAEKPRAEKAPEATTPTAEEAASEQPTPARRIARRGGAHGAAPLRIAAHLLPSVTTPNGGVPTP